MCRYSDTQESAVLSVRESHVRVRASLQEKADEVKSGLGGPGRSQMTQPLSATIGGSVLSQLHKVFPGLVCRAKEGSVLRRLGIAQGNG